MMFYSRASSPQSIAIHDDFSQGMEAFIEIKKNSIISAMR